MFRRFERIYEKLCLQHSVLDALHVSNESSRSSSAARHNILYYTVWYNRAGQSSFYQLDWPARLHQTA